MFVEGILVSHRKLYLRQTVFVEDIPFSLCPSVLYHSFQLRQLLTCSGYLISTAYWHFLFRDSFLLLSFKNNMFSIEVSHWSFSSEYPQENFLAINTRYSSLTHPQTWHSACLKTGICKNHFLYVKLVIRGVVRITFLCSLWRCF